MRTITPGPRDVDGEALLRRLGRELSQTETSAERHGRREAERLGDAAIARPLRQAAEHARVTLRELTSQPELVMLGVSPAGRATGLVFSLVRDAVVDRLLLDLERSYRSTLLGLRHGVDLIRLVAHVAETVGSAPIADFCERWLAVRLPLVDDVEDGLAWLARHPARALAPATPGWRGLARVRPGHS
jgi:hypothetical protein